MLNGCSNWMPGQYTICSTAELGIVDAAVFSYTMYVDIPMWLILCWHSSRQRLTTVALWGIERHEGGLGYANNIHESLTMIPALAVYNTQLIKIWPFTANPVVATCTLTALSWAWRPWLKSIVSLGNGVYYSIHTTSGLWPLVFNSPRHLYLKI